MLQISGKATGYWRPRDRNALPLARGQSSRNQRLESKGFGGQNWHFTYSMPETHKMQELRTKWKRVKIMCGVIYVQFAELKSTKDPPSVYVAIGKAKFISVQLDKNQAREWRHLVGKPSSVAMSSRFGRKVMIVLAMDSIGIC